MRQPVVQLEQEEHLQQLVVVAVAREIVITVSLRWVTSQSRRCQDQLRLVTWSSMRRRTRRRAAVWCNNRKQEARDIRTTTTTRGGAEQQQQQERNEWNYRCGRKQHKGAGRIIFNVNVDLRRWGNKTKPKLLIARTIERERERAIEGK